VTSDLNTLDPSLQSDRPESTKGHDPASATPPVRGAVPVVREIGGRKDGTEPTRFGDWEKNGRCIDF
jgi:hypothetical protein